MRFYFQTCMETLCQCGVSQSDGVALVGILVLAAAACLTIVPFGKTSLVIEGVIPGRASDYVDDGWRAYRNGNFEDAIAKFEHSSLISPSADAYEGLAWSYVKLNQPEQAVASFDQLVELTSGSDRGYGQRGWYYIGVKDFENALPDMEQAILLNSMEADKYYGLGLAQDGLGNTPAALEAYHQYLNLASIPDLFVTDQVQELEQPAASP